VIGDTLMPNNKLYYRLSQGDLTSYNFVRSDSNFIYYYIGTTEIPFYNLNAIVGEQWTAYINTVELVRVDTINRFNQISIEKEFKVDGLELRYVTFSDKFGPITYHSPGEPPGTRYEDICIMGCLLSNTQYGTLLSIFPPILRLEDFNLYQNYPNPFNNATTIKYQLKKGTKLEISLYSITGERIKLLYKGYKAAGEYDIHLNGSGLSSGLYFYELKSEKDILSKKCLLIK
jgi:hypothetical protein